MVKDTVWLFNFSTYFHGGGMRRLIESAKWFDMNEGAQFIVNEKAFIQVEKFSKKNIFFVVSPKRLERLINDVSYIKNILQDIDTPDVYFSFGIPIPFSIGKENWLHISNATSLTTKNINLPLKRKVEMLLLKKRIISSLRFVQIISGESEFTLNLIRGSNNYKDIFFHVLPNGFSKSEMDGVIREVGTKECYAITIGTYKYKQLDLAFKIFQSLKSKNPKLKKFIIIGNIKEVPRKVIRSNSVEVDPCYNRERLIKLLSNAEYYISASQIENSSIAALEGLIFSKNVVLSDIPSHREMLKNNYYKEIYVENSKDPFLISSYDPNNKIEENYTWNKVTPMFYEILNKYRENKYG